MAKCMLDATQNGKEISYMFEEATPVKACGDLAYRIDGSGETSFLLIISLFPSIGQHKCFIGIACLNI